MRKWTEKSKKQSKRCQQQKMIWRRRLEESNFSYLISPEVYSNVKFQMRRLRLTKKLPGRDALKEILTFLETYKPSMRYEHYDLALKAARQKVQGRRFVVKNQQHIITSLEDVEQVIKESLCTVGISDIPVKDFIYSLLGY